MPNETLPPGGNGGVRYVLPSASRTRGSSTRLSWSVIERTDPVVVKAFINLIGIYPVGTCIILDTYEVAIVHTANPDVTHVHRPVVRVVTTPDGALLTPGILIDLAEKDANGNFPRTIVKVTDPLKYGITVSDYFV